ncbi:hypothetical protein EYF80_039557 [Liparis tanakae]|uniref:Uncharacterized protein n=1 Tax=Liparis tanakae TaxID=230148 RepID=A0A4Z2GCC1_9TELE|nr:hypothetical protein EYF80_039557 [Liparis tanakae]
MVTVDTLCWRLRRGDVPGRAESGVRARTSVRLTRKFSSASESESSSIERRKEALVWSGEAKSKRPSGTATKSSPAAALPATVA